jgi:hypothetical protein
MRHNSSLRPAVVAGQEEEQRATHESRSHFPPAVAHSLNEAMKEKRMSQSVLFLDSSQAFDSRWVPPVGGAPSRRTSTSTRRCVRHQRCSDWVTKPSA